MNLPERVPPGEEGSGGHGATARDRPCHGQNVPSQQPHADAQAPHMMDGIWE